MVNEPCKDYCVLKLNMLYLGYAEKQKKIIFFIVLHNNSQVCGASVAAGPFTKKKSLSKVELCTWKRLIVDRNSLQSQLPSVRPAAAVVPRVQRAASCRRLSALHACVPRCCRTSAELCWGGGRPLRGASYPHGGGEYNTQIYFWPCNIT